MVPPEMRGKFPINIEFEDLTYAVRQGRKGLLFFFIYPSFLSTLLGTDAVGVFSINCPFISALSSQKKN